MQLSLQQRGVNITHYPAELKKHPSGWKIEFYSLNPFSEKLERISYKVNRIRKKFPSDKIASRELMNQVQQINYRLINGWSPFVDVSLKELINISKALDKFIEIKKRELREDSIRSYESQKSLFNEWLLLQNKNNILPCDFTQYDAIAYLDYIYLEKKVSNRTWNNYRGFLKTAFNWMIERGYCSKNHFTNISSKRNEQKKRKMIPAEIRTKIAEYLTENQLSFYIFILLEYSCLMRPTEIFKSRIENYNFDKQIISLDGKQTKNKKPRDIVINNELVVILRAYFDRINICKYKRTDLLFSSDYLPGRIMKNSRDSGRTWSNIRISLDLPKEYQLYSLRDTSIFDMLMQDINPKIVQKHADHQDLKMTSIYANHESDLINEEIKRNSPKF